MINTENVVVIYARYSSDNQSEESIMAQVRACREYAERNNFRVVELYIDRAFSARSDARPEFQRMIQASKEKNFQFVIVHKLDRFSRDRYDHAIYKKELRKNGVRLVSVLENLDDSPESVVLESVLEGFSEYYSRNLARETRKGLKEVALQAKFTGGTTPFGYNRDANNNYIINQIEAEAVRRIYAACLNGSGYGRLLSEFADEGIKTKFGKSFGKTSFNAILKNEKYIGRYVYYPEGTSREKISDPIIIDDAIPAIVDKKTFMEVQKIMESRKHNGRQKAIEPYLLSGILFCGECGSPMSGHRHTKSSKHTYSYECNANTRKKTCSMKTLSRDKIEKIISQYVQELLSSSTAKEIFLYLKENQKTLNNANIERIDTLEKELRSLDIKINNTVEMLIDTKSDILKARLIDMEKRQKQLIYELEQCRADELTPEKLAEYIIKIENFDKMSREQKQVHISRLIKNITINKDGDIRITTTYNDVIDKDGGTTPAHTLSMPWWIFTELHHVYK